LGIVGSLVAQLTKRVAGAVIVVDPIGARRDAALAWRADGAFAPYAAPAGIADFSGGRGVNIEATGAPSALQAAIKALGQEGTVAVISCFGTRKVPLLLFPEFHYERLKIISSMVSSLGSDLQPRWTRERRLGVAYDLLGQDWVVTPISHELPFSCAPEAYAILDTRPGDAIAFCSSTKVVVVSVLGRL
jgi:threonine dehydrogenase-like Zn-dependent dehydrogenase